jgi:hypothetical protein
LSKGIATPAGEGTNPPAAGAYGLWAAIDLRHEYEAVADAAAGPCCDLTVEPTALTAARLERYGLLTRTRADGLDLLIRADAASALRVAASAAADARGRPPRFGPPLLFTLRIARPEFLSVTQLPAGSGCGGKALVLSNAGNAPTAQKQARLAVEPGGGRATPDTLPKAGEANPGPTGWWSESKGEEAAAGEEAAEILADVLAQPFALLQLHLAPPRGGKGLFPFDPAAGEPVAPVRYEMVFEARKTRWRYVVVDRAGTLDVEQLAIVEPGGTADPFRRERPDPQVPGGARTAAFLSEKVLPVLRRPRARFRLEGIPRAGRRSVRPLVDPLPAPGAQSLTARADGAAVSEIYVFV